MIKLLILLAALIAASESVCPVYENTANIDLGEFSRDWKIQYLGINASEGYGLECLHAEFHSDHQTEAPVPARLRVHGIFIDTGEDLNERYDGVIPDLSKPGFWLMYDNGTDIEISVMYADSRDFALVLECDNNQVEAYFMAKNYNPIPDDVFQIMVGVLESNGANFENILPVPGDDVLCAPAELSSSTSAYDME